MGKPADSTRDCVSWSAVCAPRRLTIQFCFVKGGGVFASADNVCPPSGGEAIDVSSRRLRDNQCSGRRPLPWSKADRSVQCSLKTLQLANRHSACPVDGACGVSVQIVDSIGHYGSPSYQPRQYGSIPDIRQSSRSSRDGQAIHRGATSPPSPARLPGLLTYKAWTNAQTQSTGQLAIPRIRLPG